MGKILLYISVIALIGIFASFVEVGWFTGNTIQAQEKLIAGISSTIKVGEVSYNVLVDKSSTRMNIKVNIRDDNRDISENIALKEGETKKLSEFPLEIKVKSFSQNFKLQRSVSVTLISSEEKHCANECTPLGKTVCSRTSIRTCENYDDDSCLEWSVAEPCEYGCNYASLKCNLAPNSVSS